jgi:hypothetical protein
MTFEEAKRIFIHRFTMGHMPKWAEKKSAWKKSAWKKSACGKFYAPHFRTDLEWFKNTIFVENRAAITKGESWPMGRWLDKIYKK